MRDGRMCVVMMIAASACTSPTDALTISPTGFYDDGARWWSSASGPVLTGTARARPGAVVEAFADGKDVGPLVAIVNGTWMLPLPDGTIVPGDTTITVRIAGDAASAQQVIALDDSTPHAAAIATSIRDERADQIDFSSGVPVHVHAGAAIALGDGCPDVYVYGYLHGETAPVYGRQTTPNPLAFAFRGMAPHALAGTARYRVRADDGTIVLDWTDAPAAASDGSTTITLVRDGAHAIAFDALAGVHYVDVAYDDWAGREVQASACWNHHALAAPIEIIAPAAATGGSAIGAFALGNGSPVSALLERGQFVPAVWGATLVQQTAEPITLAIQLAPPTGTFAITGVFDFVAPVASTAPVACGNTCAPRSLACVAEAAIDARCNTNAIATTRHTTASGALTTGAWSIAVIGSDASAPCTAIDALTLSCTIPPRRPGAPAVEYALTASLDGVSNLKPTPGAYAEQDAGGFIYTGLAPSSASRCTTRVASAPDSDGAILQTCTSWVTYTGIVGLGAARLQLDATALSISSSTGASELAPLAYVAAPIAVPPITWDGGTSGLP